jgi:glycogen synthase
MHIGLLTPEYPSQARPEGGLANYIKRAGEMLVQRGHDVDVFAVSDRSALWEDGQVIVHEIARRSMGRQRWPGYIPLIEQLVLSQRLRQAVLTRDRDAPFDIIQASSYLALGYRLIRNVRIPMVCRVSSYTPLLRSANGRERNFIAYLSDWLELRQILDADGAFAPSSFMADCLERIEGYRPEVIHTPPPTSLRQVDQSLYRQLAAGKRFLLYFGTLNRVKGADLLAGVLPRLLQNEQDLWMIVIGRDDGLPGGEKLSEHITKACGSLAERVLFSETVPRSRLVPFLLNSVGVVMPSRVDNYPNACLEAQALGAIIVGTHRSSLDEMIIDGKTGFLAENGSADSLLESIRRLLALSPGEREGMREKVLGLHRNRLAQDSLAKLLGYYESVIQRFRARAGEGNSTER